MHSIPKVSGARLAVRRADVHIANLRTRMPFRYGIASMTALPHVFVRVVLEVNGFAQAGVSADSLPPKWFTKNPKTAYADDVADMLEVISRACALAGEARGECVFDLLEQIYLRQKAWASEWPLPPLLWNFGVSLVERAMIDAFCRASGVTFAAALRRGMLGFSLKRMRELAPEAVDEQVARLSLDDVLPSRPLEQITVRQTVGLGDALADDQIAQGDRLDDGLPQSLASVIGAYGIRLLKIKLGGDAESDAHRLRQLAEVLSRHAGDYACTLDGNENFRDVGAFRALWESLVRQPRLRDFLSRVLFVEQPLHRDVALSEDVRRALLDWHDRPALIIDESDAALGDLGRALACGYVGTSHKNCKGVFKGLTNAAILAAHRRREPGRRLVLSGEDLANIGPVALLQDLTVSANLGIDHVERNGHHYFTGLSMFPQSVQQHVLENHGDLYRRHERGFPTLDIRYEQVRIGSLIDAPFGVGFELDVEQFTPADQWRFESLMA